MQCGILLNAWLCLGRVAKLTWRAPSYLIYLSIPWMAYMISGLWWLLFLLKGEQSCVDWHWCTHYTAKRLGCVLSAISLFSIPIADGKKIQSHYTCKAVVWKMQGISFESDMLILPIGNGIWYHRVGWLHWVMSCGIAGSWGWNSLLWVIRNWHWGDWTTVRQEKME